jgi:hypothetical protein
MHKIFFGTIVFFSLAFLAACGGGGSGSTGATGATGAAGSAASGGGGSVPDADSDLAIAISTTPDPLFASTLGNYTEAFLISGTDNVSEDSRVRYYMYLGSTATAKTDAQVTASASGFSGFTSAIPLDPRLKTSNTKVLRL